MPDRHQVLPEQAFHNVGTEPICTGPASARTERAWLRGRDFAAGLVADPVRVPGGGFGGRRVVGLGKGEARVQGRPDAAGVVAGAGVRLAASVIDLDRMTAGERRAYQLGLAARTETVAKPGWKSSEFVLTLIGQVYAGLFGLLVLLDQSIELDRALTVLGAVGAAASAGAWYTNKRAAVKTAEMEARG